MITMTSTITEKEETKPPCKKRVKAAFKKGMPGSRVCY
jgi:hypothetical protein